MSDDDSDVSFEDFDKPSALQARPALESSAQHRAPAPKASERGRTLSNASDLQEELPYGKARQAECSSWSSVDQVHIDNSALQLVQSIVTTAPTDESIRDVAWQPLAQFTVAQEPVDPLGMGRIDLEHMKLVRAQG